MYINTSQNIKCSKCGVKNFSETVTTKETTHIRCRNCGHQKATTTLSTSYQQPSMEKVQQAYVSKINTQEQTF